MMAPSGGFDAPGSSGGMGVSGYLADRKRIAVAGLNSVNAADDVFAASWRSGSMSSRIQNDRPCVPTAMSSSLSTRSRIDVAGMFSRSDDQWSPSSNETH